MLPDLPVPNPQFGLSRYKLAIPPGYAGPSDKAELIRATNRLNEIRFTKLTHKQRFFLDSYITSGMDPLAAARAARLCPDDATDKEAIKAAASLIRKKFMQEAIEAALAWSATNAKISAPALVQSLVPIAESNMADYLDDNGNVSLPLYDRDKMAAIKEIRVDVVRVGRGVSAQDVEKTSIKLYDKVDTTIKLLKLIGYEGAQDAPATQVNVQQNNTNVSVKTINIMPVPRGQFLPAPERPADAICERLPVIGRGA